MRFLASVAALSVALGLSACGDSNPEPEAPAVATTPNPMGEMEMGVQTAPEAEHRATGTVTAVEGGRVTINHGPVETIGWPAMTMSFAAPQESLSKIEPGDQVAFTFRQEGTDQVITSITPQR